MTDKIVALATRKVEINQDVVNLLKDMLARAERGEFKGVAVVGIEQDGSSVTTSSQSECFQQLIGGLSILQFRMMSNQPREML